MCTHGHRHISGHRPLKTSSHPAVHIHVSPIVTCCIVENPSEVVPSFPFFGSPSRFAERSYCRRRGRRCFRNLIFFATFDSVHHDDLHIFVPCQLFQIFQLLVHPITTLFKFCCHSIFLNFPTFYPPISRFSALPSSICSTLAILTAFSQ